MKPKFTRKGGDMEPGFPEPNMGLYGRLTSKGANRIKDIPGSEVGVAKSGGPKERYGTGQKGSPGMGDMAAQEPAAYGTFEHDFGPDNADDSWHTSNNRPGASMGHELEADTIGESMGAPTDTTGGRDRTRRGRTG